MRKMVKNIDELRLFVEVIRRCVWLPEIIARWRKTIMSHFPLFCIMQAVDSEQKKSVMVSAEVHRRIVSLRRGDQTYGDVVEASIRALEEQESRSDIPCIDDISDEEINQIFREAREHPEECSTLEESMKEYEELHRKK